MGSNEFGRVCVYEDTNKKNVSVYAQVLLCACYMLLVIAEIFLIPSLSGPAGCFRVSGIGEGGNMAEGGNVWQED